MIEVPDFLPLGSVVSLKGNEKTLMIIGRALVHQKDDGQKEYYDYSFCPFPEGLIRDAVIFSNHEQIDKIHSIGFTNEADEELMAITAEVLPKLTMPKADPMPFGEW